MTIRDQGPLYNVGFGATSRNPLQPQNEEEGPNPESGFIAKALHGHPIMRFFAVSAATVVGAAVAGSVVRKGGIRLGLKLSESEAPWIKGQIKEFKKVQELLDSWEGVHRLPIDSEKLFVRDEAGKILGDKVTRLQGFEFTNEEKAAGARYAQNAAGEPLPEWTLRREVQQSLVSQARRLPYELPAAYIAQKALIDPIFRGEKPDNNFKWYNPADVISDFVTSSVKNTAFAFAPMAAGGGAAKQGWRRFMTLGDDLSTNLTPMQQTVQGASISLKTILGQVGADATELIQKTVSLSSRSTGAFAAGLKEAQSNNSGLVDYLHKVRQGLPAYWARESGKRSTTAKILGSAQYLSGAKAPPGMMDLPNLFDIGPGPFSGLGSGIRKVKSEWTHLGRVEETYQEMLNEGMTKFMANASPERKALVKEAMGRVSGPIPALANQMNTIAQGGPDSGAWRNSEFYRDQIRNEYHKNVARELKKQDVPADIVDRFLRKTKLNAPGRGVEEDITKRINFGRGTIFADNNDDFYKALLAKVDFLSKDKNSLKGLVDKLPGAMKQVDQKFEQTRFAESIDRKIAATWKAYEQGPMLVQASRLMKGLPLEYEKFAGSLSDQQQIFLRRRAADLLGAKTVDDAGGPVSDAILNNALARQGINPSNTNQIRAYLISNGAMTKPWQVDGRNIFGFKSVTLSAGLQRGYFGGDEYIERQINQIADGVTKLNPNKASGGYKLGGMYETINGNILDVARIGKGFRSFADKFSTDYQIPLLQFNPLSLFNVKGAQAVRSRSILQYVPSRSVQPFLRGTNESADFYMWMRSGVRGSKGNIVSVGLDAEGAIATSSISGTYRPFPAIGESIITRHTQFAAKDIGKAPGAGQEARKSWLQKVVGRFGGPTAEDRLHQFLSPSIDNSGSLFSYLRAFKNRAGDINNPMVMSRLLSGEEMVVKGSTLKLVDGQVLKDGEIFKNKAQVAKALDTLGYALRPYGMEGRALRTVLEKHEGLLDITFHKENTPISFAVDAEGKASLADLKTPTQIIEFARRVGSQDSRLRGLSSDIENVLRRARKGLIYRHLEDAGEEGYWTTASGLAHKSSVIHSRIDELKSDLEKYVILRTQALGEQTKSQYSELINDLMTTAFSARSAKDMSQAEFTEFRTALLSLQLNYQSFVNYKRPQGSLEDAMDVIKGLMGAGKPTQEALASFGRGEVGISTGRLGKVQPFVRRRFGIARPEFEGTEYNPFGAGTSTVFVPTFGTAFARNPVKALLSATGVDTYGNTEGFSGMSIPMSHFIERLNKPFELLGMGLDQTAFAGPLDLYARGLVGKRILPVVGLGAGALAVDRTIGGYANPKDKYGDRQYKPFFLGGAATGLAAGQAALTGAIPGGMGYREKYEQLTEGEVPVRQGRFWPLGNTPFMGGRIQYFRPSWYRRFMSGYQYTDQTHGSPMERLAFGYDFSPLRPLDPYRFEREHYRDRPYPVTGDYFTGPWGPLTSALNMTIGRVLKPRKMMHEDEVSQGLSQYAPVGEGGAYFGPALGGAGGGVAVGGVGGGIAVEGGGGGGGGGRGLGIGGGGGNGIAVAGKGGSGAITNAMLSQVNTGYAAAGSQSLATGANITKGTLSNVNQAYSNIANINQNAGAAYGIPTGTGMPPKILSAQPPVSMGSARFQAGKFGYESQELLGAYGFMIGSARKALGLGDQDFASDQPALASASQAYGTSRAFWDLNLGGTGDVPTPFGGNFGNLEISEIMRRFVPKPRSQVQQINPIPNELGIMQPWLPGADYFTDFTRGDPFAKIPEGEMRLPGQGYERLHPLHPDRFGQYGLADRFKILGDVAPWSNEYHALERQIDSFPLNSEQQDMVDLTRSQVDAKAVKHQFTPYKHKYETPQDMLGHPVQALVGRWWESFEHKNTFFNSKFLPVRTAVEDWERENVYGATFPEWQHPMQDFLKPMVYTSTQRNPIVGASILAAVGTLFGRRARGKAVGSAVGAAVGLAAGTFGQAHKLLTGRRYIPEPRREQLALEEYSDILNYVKNMHLYNQSMMQGNTSAANAYRQAAQQTMYGADIYNTDLNQVALAIPERKRDYFRAMLSAPEEEREQILSTAPRLERRIYEAAWGKPVEKRPELEEYFQEHELPGASWEGFYPNTNMDQIKIKIGQHLGIDMSEMGYYPQQINEANMVNPSYPNFNQPAGGRDVRSRLKELMDQHGVRGSVQKIYTPYPGNRLEIQSGVS